MERTAALFARCFGHPPRWVVAAPGRVNLIGEHTDYNDGFVLPMAIQRYVVIAADANPSRQVTLHSVTTGETASFNVRPKVERGAPDWSNYVRGVIAGFQGRKRQVGGFDAVIESTLPYGGGLASSAALEVATATLLEAMVGAVLDPIEKALLCQQAEHDFAGVPCGIMDQFTSILARENHALLLDCRSRTTTPVPLTDPAVTVLIVNTNIRHKLAESEYAKRRSRCEEAARVLKVAALRDATLDLLKAARRQMEPVVFRRARHVISENERTLQAAQAIQASDWAKVGELMYASHTSLREDYEVSCPELDAVVEIAQEMGAAAGVIGCRMTGGGFGGCAVSLVKTEAVQQITRKLDELYEKKTGQQTSIFSSRPAGGASILKS
jgi:galactokinase